MRQNPRDWRIDDLQTVARAHTVEWRQHGASHVTFRQPSGSKLTNPAHRPIRSVCIKKFVRFVETGVGDYAMRPEGYPFEVQPLPNEDGGGFLITFPDLPGCVSDGDTLEEALRNGLDAAESWLRTAYEPSHKSIWKEFQ